MWKCVLPPQDLGLRPGNSVTSVTTEDHYEPLIWVAKLFKYFYPAFLPSRDLKQVPKYNAIYISKQSEIDHILNLADDSKQATLISLATAT